MTRKEEIDKEANSFANTVSIGEEEIAKTWSAFMSGAEWADRTMIEKVYDFIRINAYKYRQLKFVKNKATFDFRTDRLIEDLRKAMEE